MRNLLAFLAALCMTITPAYAALIPSIPYNLTNGSLADATQVMGNFNTIVTDVNTNGAHNGANSDITSLTGLTTPLATTFGGSSVYVGGTTGGSANAQTLATVLPASFTLTAGNIVTGIAGYTNTGAATLSVISGSAISIEKTTPAGLVALTGGEIVAGQPYVFYYDGTNYDIISAVNPPLATSSVAGIVIPDGTIITVSAGAITVAKGSSSAFGVVKTDGSTIGVSAGVISCTTSTSSQLGCVKPDGTTITASSGTLTVPYPLMTAEGVGGIICAQVPTGHNAGYQIAAASITPYTCQGNTGTGDSITGTWQYLQNNNVGSNEVILVQRVN